MSKTVDSMLLSVRARPLTVSVTLPDGSGGEFRLSPRQAEKLGVALLALGMAAGERRKRGPESPQVSAGARAQA